MKSIYLSFLTLFIFSCNSNDDNNDNCIEYEAAGIELVEPNVNATSNEYLFDLSFRVKNGCGEFSSIEQNTVGTTTTIKVIAKYEGCICTQDAPLRKTIYNFNQTNPGTYTLKFQKADDSYITQEVVIP